MDSRGMGWWKAAFAYVLILANFVEVSSAMLLSAMLVVISAVIWVPFLCQVEQQLLWDAALV